MKRITTVLVATGLAVTLGGCNTILKPFGLTLGGQRPDNSAPAYAAAQKEYFEGRLADAKAEMAHGNFAAAMQAFRQASLGRETRAEALNGLGVAYVGIGRLDLARRYFYEAASLDPTDQRFAANIARLHRELNAQDETMLAARERMDAPVAAVAEAPRAATVGELAALAEAPVRLKAPSPVTIAARPQVRTMAGGAIRVGVPAANVNRVSTREVAITTHPANTAATIKVASRTQGKAESYPVRIDLSEAAASPE